MDTRFLETFLAVVDTGSLAEAGRRLGLTPTAVAQRLRALDDEFGVRLVVRTGRTVAATEAGIAIAARTRHLLRDMRDLKALAAQDRPAGQLRLGAVPTAIAGLLPDIMVRSGETFPDLDIAVMPGLSTELYAKTLAGELDMALLVQPHFALPKTCGWRTLRNEPLIVLAPAVWSTEHPHNLLATKPFIRYGRQLWTGRLIDDYLRRAAIRPKERLALGTLDAIAVLVDRALGVSLVPDWARPWPEGLDLAKLPLPEPSEPRRLGLLWNLSSPRIRLIRAVLDQSATESTDGAGSSRY